MGFNIPMKKTGAYNTDSIVNKFGVKNSGNKKNALSNNTLTQNFRNNNNNNSHTTVKQPRPSGNGLMLQRGQKIKLCNINSGSKLKFCFGWDIKNPECDLDGSAFMLDGRNKVISEDWFIFYGNPKSPDNSLHYKVYDNGHGAEINIDTSRIKADVQKIVMSVTIYEAFERNLNFGMIKNVYVSISESSKNIEIAHFDITECFSSITALVIGELYRYNNEWKFNAVGSGVRKDLAGFCGMYGVDIV